MSNAKDYLTPNEVAVMLRVATVTVRSWATKGLLRAVLTPGGHRRFLRKDVEEFVRETGAGEPFTALRVLIVDDDPFIAEYLGAVLEKSALHPVLEAAQDGFDAGLKVATFGPQVVLLDLMMPGLDGFEVCRRIKADPATRSIRVLAMSSAAEEGNRRRILDAGAEIFFPKPVDEAALLRALSPASLSLQTAG